MQIQPPWGDWVHGDQKAVIIGVNAAPKSIGQPLRFAERDAQAVFEILTDRDIGTFDRSNVTLLLGADATWRKIKQKLRQLVVSAQPSDVLLVYFAGHSFAPEWSRQQDAYLVTSDLDVTAISDEPDNGLRMAFLRRDVFESFAGSSLLILDCCQAGLHVAIDNPGAASAMTHGSSQLDRHSALLSCRAGEAARENSDTGHGLLTNELLRALQGEAADSSGRVNFTQMATFVIGQNLVPTPGHVVQTWGPTCTLTDLTGRRRSGASTRLPPAATIVVCENPLDRCASTIIQLMDRIFRPSAMIPRQQSPLAGFDRLHIVRAALEAESVAVLAFGAHGLDVMDSTARFSRDQLAPLIEQSRAFAFPQRTIWSGHVISHELSNGILFVPLHHDAQRTLVLTVVDPAPSFLEMGEALALLLKAIWKSDVLDDPAYAEVTALTALRSAFGRLPTALYEHCFKLYMDVVSTFQIVFQPVVFLDRNPVRIGIDSYEALARRTEAENRAPVAMLDAAHVWGDRFVIERDSLLFAKSVEAYANADGQTSGDIIKPVSVNVAVRSLLSDSYISVVKAVVDDVSLDPRKVTLEISEQDAIEPRATEIWTEDPLRYFHARLTALTRQLEVGFAVDDFGVGYSSLARMAELTLTQIKVDRAILHHPLALEELDLIVRIANHARDIGRAPTARAVVVEGFDDESPVPLSRLYEHRIRYVQGYISGARGSSSLHPLGDAVRRRIAGDLMRGEDDNSSAKPSAAGNR